MYQRQHFDRYLTVAEERQLFQTIKQHMNKDTQRGLLAMRDYYAFKFMRNTGLRVGTVVGMRVIDALNILKARRLQLPKAIMKGRRHDLDTYCNKSALDNLRKLLIARQLLGYAPNADERLLVSREGEALSDRSMRHRLQHWRELAGLDAQASPHWLRHTLAKRVMKNSTARDPRAIVGALLGQRDPRSTVMYTLPDKEDIEQASEEVAA